MATNTCPECFRHFEVKNYSNRKYCSIECRATAWARRSGRDYDEVLRSLKNQQRKQKKKTRYGHGAPCAWRCHDCGCKTDLYRCPDCKAKWLKKHGLAPGGEEAHDDAYRLLF